MSYLYRVNTSESYQKWLQAAYRLLAEKGPENLSIKALAKQCGLPRTNFYYYFENKKELIDEIIELHFQTTTEIFNIELNKRLHTFIPDLYVILYDFKLGVQFSKQLFKNRENYRYNKAYKQGVALSADLIAPKFKDFFKIDLSHEAVKSLWFILTDTWYSRLNFNNFSVDSLCALSYEIMESVLPLIEQNINIDSNSNTTFDTPV
ncbi:TetR/AcrR family transcriptional regulator [Draconibacterium sp.]|nr:TetR/AcrR family transcriptional regulator [Draconibacterium sp.]